MSQEKLEGADISTTESPIDAPVSPEDIQDGEISSEMEQFFGDEQIQNVTDEQEEVEKAIKETALSGEQEITRMAEIREQLGLPAEEATEAILPPSVTERNERLNELQKRKEELEKQRNELLNKQEKNRRIEEEKQRILREKTQRYLDEHPELSGRGGGTTSGGASSNVGNSSEGAPRPIPAEAYAVLEAEALEEAIKNIEREIAVKEKEIIDEEKDLEEKTDESSAESTSIADEEDISDQEVVSPVSIEVK